MSTIVVVDSSVAASISSTVAAGAFPEERESVCCKNPRCDIRGKHQFRTANNLCRRCRKPLPGSVEISSPKNELSVTTVSSARKLAQKEGHNWLAIGIAQAMRAFRKVRHLSQRRLAELIGVASRTYISKIERGCAMPTLDSLERLADRLGVTLFDFVSLASAAPSEFDRVLEDILAPEIILYYFRKADPKDQACFCEYVEKLSLQRAGEKA